MSATVHSVKLIAYDSVDLAKVSYQNGDVVYDTTNTTLRIMDGKTPGGFPIATQHWVTNNVTASGVYVSTSKPTGVPTGQLWFDSNNGNLYIYLGSQWVQPASVAYGSGGGGGSIYILPPATTSVLGGVIVDGTTITVSNTGVISATSGGSYTLPTATTSTLGGVIVDGTTITINNGIITAVGGGGSSYTLPTASTSILGGVKVDGTTITISGSGVITSVLPTASTSILGGVKVDGTTITINGSGVISGASTLSAATTSTLGGVIVPTVATSGLTVDVSGNLSLATASTTQLGGVLVDGTTITISSGVIKANYTNYTLPAASSSALGGVIVPIAATSGLTNSSGTIGLATAGTTQLGGVKIDGTSITINGSGVISASSSYSLPTASTTTLGGVKVDGSSVTITGGVISATVAALTYGARTTASTTTASLTAGSSATATVAMGKGYILYSIQSSAGAWVTVYSNSSAQSSDSSRALTTDPTPGSGVLAESITSGATTTYFSPAVFGYNNDGTVTTTSYLKIYNNSGSTAAITVTLTYLRLE
jgi:hypothetical protein